MTSFNEVCIDVTKTAKKIPQSDYLVSGKYKIFDQGKDYIGGYTNDKTEIVEDYPYIVFGDHTRIVKFVDEPCFIGADGVKLLKVYNSQFLPKYVYYSLVANPIVSLGYSRHFKYLKEQSIRDCSINEQERIITELETNEKAISIKKESLSSLDELVKSRFIEMFGYPFTNEKGYPLLTIDDVMSFQGGSQPDKKYFEYTKTDENVRLIQIRDYKTDKFITYIPKSMAKRYCTKEDIMIGRYGPPIFQILQGIEGSYNVALMKAIPKMGNRDFIRYFLKQDCLLEYLQQYCKRVAGQDGIQMDKLKEFPFPYPPIELQNEYAEFVKLIDKSKFIVQQQIKDLQELLDSKMDEYFR